MWIILLDRSGSMGNPFVGKTDEGFAGRVRVSRAEIKLDAAKESLLEHLSGLGSHTRLILVEFTSKASVVFDGSSSERESIQEILKTLEPYNGTDIAVALSTVTEYITRTKATDTEIIRILIISDGLSELKPAEAAARKLVAYRAIIDVILIDPTVEGESVSRAIALNGSVSAVTSYKALFKKIGEVLEPPEPIRLAPRPPIIIHLRKFIIVTFIITAFFLLLSHFVPFFNSMPLVFTSKMILLTEAICSTPTIANWLTKRKNRIDHVIVESLMFIVLLLCFSKWFVGIPVWTDWIVPTGIMILLLEIGSNIVDHYKINTLECLNRTIELKEISNQIKDIEEIFRTELALYIPVPIGLIIGTITSWFNHQAPKDTITSSLVNILWLASLILLYFLCIAFERMRDPLFSQDNVSSPSLAKKQKNFIGMIFNLYRLIVPQKLEQDSELKEIALACAVRDLRKIYFYDAVHNVVLFVATTSVLLFFFEVDISPIWLIISLILGIVFFTVLPYVLGQAELHSKLVEGYQGTKRMQRLRKIREHSSLFPVNSIGLFFRANHSVNLLEFLFDRRYNQTFEEILKIMNERRKDTILLKTLKTMAEKEGSKYHFHQPQIGNFIDTAQSGSRQQSINHQHNYAPEQKQTLAEAAAEIQKLLKQLEQTNPSATETEKKAYVTASIPPTLRARSVSALKAGGKEALKELLDNPYVNIGVAIVEGWQSPE